MEGLGNRRCTDLHFVVASRVRAQRCGDIDGHLPFVLLELDSCNAASSSKSAAESSTRIVSCSNFLSSSVSPASRNEFVTVALPFATEVITYEHPSQCASAKSVADHCAG